MRKKKPQSDSVITGVFPDAMKETPSGQLTYLLRSFNLDSNSIEKQVGSGLKFINVAKGVLRFEYGKIKEQFVMSEGWDELEEEITDLTDTLTQYSDEGKRGQREKIRNKMARLINDFFLYQLQLKGILVPELAEERIDVLGKSGQAIGYRIPVNVSRAEQEEMRKLREMESKTGGMDED